MKLESEIRRENANKLTFSETAQAILSERYFVRDADGRYVEDAPAMFRRVAVRVAEPSHDYGERVEQWAEKFLSRMERMEFVPNSPTLMNAGIAGG